MSVGATKYRSSRLSSAFHCLWEISLLLERSFSGLLCGHMDGGLLLVRDLDGSKPPHRFCCYFVSAPKKDMLHES